jgi:hypothetical protein
VSIASEISRLQTAKANLKTQIEAKGVTVPSSTKLDGYPSLVASIPSGGGGEDIPVFTATFDDDTGDLISFTCNKTFAQCLSILDEDLNCTAIFHYIFMYDNEVVYESKVPAAGSTDLETYITYTAVFDNGFPDQRYTYYANGTLTDPELVEYAEVLNVTSNGDYSPADGKYYAYVSVDVPGSPRLDTRNKTLSVSYASIQFTSLKGEPTSFVIVCRNDLAADGSAKSAAVVYDGTNTIGQYITSSGVTYSDSAFSWSYSNGTLTVTGTDTNFMNKTYRLYYTCGGVSENIQTKKVQVGSGATSITFTGLTEEPMYWSCMFTSNIGTSSGYTRAHVVVNDGTDIYGMEMGSGSTATSNWTASYSNGSLTITSQSASAGGYFHQPGYYQLTYAVAEPVIPSVEPLTVTENGSYSVDGKAYSPVTVNVSGGGGSVSVETKTTTLSAVSQTIQFTSLKGTPKYWFLRTTAQISSSSTTYYYIVDIRYNGTNTTGNSFRLGSTRRIYNITSGLSYTYSNGTLTVTAGSSSSSSPGQFYNGEYELVYIY